MAIGSAAGHGPAAHAVTGRPMRSAAVYQASARAFHLALSLLDGQPTSPMNPEARLRLSPYAKFARPATALACTASPVHIFDPAGSADLGAMTIAASSAMTSTGCTIDTASRWERRLPMRTNPTRATHLKRWKTCQTAALCRADRGGAATAYAAREITVVGYGCGRGYEYRDRMSDLAYLGPGGRGRPPRPLLRTLVGDVLRRNRLGQRRTLADVARVTSSCWPLDQLARVSCNERALRSVRT